MMMWVSRAAHASSAAFSERRRLLSISTMLSPTSERGFTLNSMLNRANSVWYFGFAIAASTSSLSILGW